MKSLNKTQQQILKAVFAILFSGAATGYSQVKYNADESIQILKKISEKLNSLQSISYQYKREILYAGENYHTVLNTIVYIDFSSGTPAYRFQSEDDKFLSCYNGIDYFGVSKTDKTIDIKKNPPPQLFESLSPLYNSMVSLRTILPLIVNNDSIKNIITDTTINKENLYKIQVELYNHYFSNLGSINNFSAAYTGDKNKPYELLINKKTLLPFMFTSKFKDRPKDFISSTFTAIDIQPQSPPESSWQPSTYALEFTALKSKKPLIATGTIPVNWTLPVYTTKETDSASLYQFRDKIVMLDFWVRSCGPCIASFPHLNELQKRFGKEKFQLLSVNTEDTKEQVGFFNKKYKIIYPMLFEGKELAKDYGVTAYPTIIILNKEGKIIYASGENGFDLTVIEKIIQDNL